jgi:transposase
MQEPQEIHAEEHEQLVARVVAIDVAKASGMVCTRVPHASAQGRRVTKVWEVPATTGAIIELGGHLAGLGVEKVTVESTPTTCDVRVHECKWEAPLEVQLMLEV